MRCFAAQSARPGAPPLLLRLYGTPSTGEAAARALFSRASEVAVAEATAALGAGPRVFALFANGRLEEFLPGEPLSAPAMRTPAVAAAVAAQLARFHVAATARLGGDCDLFSRLSDWHAKALVAAAARPPGADLMQRLAETPARLEALRQAMAPWAASGKPGSGTVFAHADLQHNNILLLNNSGAEQSTAVHVALVDYEYALRAPAAFDIGNHFCERAADYAEAPLDGGGMLNYPLRYPGAAERVAFCAAYLAALPGGDTADAAAAEALADAADAAAAASHAVWALWGVCQAVSSSIDWDFLGYARQRFDAWDAHAARRAAQA